jgi:hypothetical protein
MNKIGISAVLVVVIAASGSLLVAKASPEHGSTAAAAPAQFASTASKAFVPTCTAAAIDTRKDPAWVGASFAHDNCTAPVLPVAVDGYSASREQVVASIAAQKKYVVQANDFQRCIVDFVAARKATASRERVSMDVALTVIENHRLAASQASKQRVADQVNISVMAFNEDGSECK